MSLPKWFDKPFVCREATRKEMSGGIIQPSDYEDRMSHAVCTGNIQEYRRLRERRDRREEMPTNKFDLGGMGGFAYLPMGDNGQLLKVECVVMEVNYEIMNHYSSRMGLQARDKQICTSIDVHLKVNGPGEEVDDTFSGSIEDYSIMELLSEVEKRTRIEELMIS